MLVFESTGRKLKDAIDNGLAQVGKSLAEVEIEVLDNGGLFRKAKVRITVPGEEQPAKKEEPVKEEQKVVKEVAHTEKRERPVRDNREAKSEGAHKEHKPHREPKQEQRAPKAKEEQKETAQKEEVGAIREPRHYEPVTPEVVKKAEDFVTTLIEKMGVEAGVSTEVEEGRLKITLTTESSTAIGYHGEVLDSIEYLTNYVVNHDKFYHVVVDCNDYREKRKESLVALANKMAAKCLKVRHKISLEPMNSNERKIIHSALADNDQIITRSEGHEPNRHIVILCKKR